MKFNLNANFMKGLLKKTGQMMSKNSPIIAASLGVIGLGAAVFSAIKAAPKAKDLIEKAEIEKNNDEFKAAQEEHREVHITPLTKKEKAKIYGKVFLPTIAITAVTAGCIVGSVILANRQTAKAMLLYGTAATTLEQYKDAAKEVVGEKGERKIHDKMVQNKVDSTEFDESQVIQTGKGNTLCYDTYSGRLFRSDIQAIRAGINDLNTTLLDCETVTLNDYYYALGLNEIKQSFANETGWRYSKDYPGADGLLELRPTSGILPGTSLTYYAVDLNRPARDLYNADVPWR